MPTHLKRITLVLFALGIAAGCDQSAEDRPVRTPSIMELYADPEYYDNHRVVIHGYLGGNGGGSALYQNESEALIASSARVVIIDEKRKEIVSNCGWSYVVISGVYAYAPSSREHLFERVGTVSKLSWDDSEIRKISTEPCYIRE